MKRILPAVCIAFAAAVAVNAQSTSPTTQQPTDRSQDHSKMSKQTVTLSGCVRQGDDANTFVLADVDANELNRATAGQPGSQTGTTAGTTTGTTGSPDRMDRGDEAKSVQLVGSANVNLRQHVGHQVSVTGTMVPPGMDRDRPRTESREPGTAATGTAGTPPTSDTTARTGEYGKKKADKDKSKKAKHKVNVQSVQMIAETCK
jgi:hypothetical protein